MVLDIKKQRTLLWFTGVSVLLASGLWLIGGLVWPITVQPAVLSKRLVVPAQIQRPRHQIDLSAFESLWSMDLQRSLYDTPKTEAPSPQPSPPPRVKLRLLGTVIEPGNAQAILQTSDNRIEFKRVGDSLENATLQAMKETQVEMIYHNQTITLALENQ